MASKHLTIGLSNYVITNRIPFQSLQSGLQGPFLIYFSTNKARFEVLSLYGYTGGFSVMAFILAKDISLFDISHIQKISERYNTKTIHSSGVIFQEH